jgi:hypothetical protein
VGLLRQARLDPGRAVGVDVTDPLPPHQDPRKHDELGTVTMLEYVTTVLAQLDRRHEALYETLRDSIDARLRDADLRYQQRFDAQTSALDAALAAQKEAVQTANAAAEKRFESINEFRQQLADQAATFMPRAEAEQRSRALTEKIDLLHSSAIQLQGRAAGLNSGWVYLLGAVAAIGTIISLVIALR